MHRLNGRLEKLEGSSQQTNEYAALIEHVYKHGKRLGDPGLVAKQPDKSGKLCYKNDRELGTCAADLMTPAIPKIQRNGA